MEGSRRRCPRTSSRTVSAKYRKAEKSQPETRETSPARNRVVPNSSGRGLVHSSPEGPQEDVRRPVRCLEDEAGEQGSDFWNRGNESSVRPTPTRDSAHPIRKVDFVIFQIAEEPAELGERHFTVPPVRFSLCPSFPVALVLTTHDFVPDGQMRTSRPLTTSPRTLRSRSPGPSASTPGASNTNFHPRHGIPILAHAPIDRRTHGCRCADYGTGR